MQSATVLADAVKDGMGMLVQGLSGALQAPVDSQAAERLDRVERALQVVEEEARTRHSELMALLGARNATE